MDPDVALAQLTRRFPGVHLWLGDFTGHYWAFVRDRFGHDRLIEATSPTDLSLRLSALHRRPPAPFRNQRPVPRQVHQAKHHTPRTGRQVGRPPGFFNRALRSLVHRAPSRHSRTGERR